MATMRKIVSKNCREIGLTDLTEAGDGAKAWEAINNAKLPFVLVTAEAEQHQIAEAMKAGVSGYVVKPFTAELLRKQLEAVYQRLTQAA
jgi:two-component system chemotaxis response regulator CheY